MKKILVFIVLAGLVAVITNAQDTRHRTRNKSGKERMAAREKRIQAAGGLLVRPYAGKKIYIVNDQKRIDEKSFFNGTQSINELFNFPVEVVPLKSDLKDAAIIITLSDNNTAPVLLIAPEIPWAGINLGALAADNPKPDVLKARLNKELWRAFMFTCGAANSKMQPCVMRPIFGIKDLDSNSVAIPCPESLPRIMETAKLLGIGFSQTCTYKQACIEGWAPAPTNNIQKVIWEEVRSEKERGPTNPIEIPMPKKK